MPRSVLLGRPWPLPGEPLFTQEDTDWAIALHEQEAAEAAERCPLCGLPKSICRDIDNQFRFAADREQCHATYALLLEQEKHAGDENTKQATAWSAHLKPPPAPST